LTETDVDYKKIQIRVIGGVFSYTMVSQQLCWTWNVDGGAFIRKCDALSYVTLNIPWLQPMCEVGYFRERERAFLVGLVPPWPSTGMIQEWKYIQGRTKERAIRAAAQGASL